MDNPRNLNNEFELVLKDSGITNITQDFSEIAIDGILDDGILRDIPIISTLVSLINFGNTVSKNIFVKKIYKFLFELNSVSVKERNMAIEKINSSGEYQGSVGETVFEILEKIDSNGKPEIIGRLFASFLKGEIDYKRFLNLSHIVKGLFYYDLLLLKNHDENLYLYEGNSAMLESYGLTSQGYNAWEKPKPEEGCTGELTELGRDIVLFGLP